MYVSSSQSGFRPMQRIPLLNLQITLCSWWCCASVHGSPYPKTFPSSTNAACTLGYCSGPALAIIFFISLCFKIWCFLRVALGPGAVRRCGVALSFIGRNLAVHFSHWCSRCEQMYVHVAALCYHPCCFVVWPFVGRTEAILLASVVPASVEGTSTSAYAGHFFLRTVMVLRCGQSCEWSVLWLGAVLVVQACRQLRWESQCAAPRCKWY